MALGAIVMRPVRANLQVLGSDHSQQAFPKVKPEQEPAVEAGVVDLISATISKGMKPRYITAF